MSLNDVRRVKNPIM